MIKQSLNGKWKLYYCNELEKDLKSPSELSVSNESVECIVPGNVELDLSRQGLLPEDLFFADNMKECEKYETYQWWYEKEFDLKPDELQSDLYLCFEGTDTFAEYFLNGIRIGESHNMLIPHEFCINKAAKEKNILHVKISSTVLKEHNEDYSALSLMVNPYPAQRSVAIRKAPHTYGWDILPRAVSAGLWRSVSLIRREKVEFRQLFCFCGEEIKYNELHMTFLFDLDCPFSILKKSEIVISGKCRDSEFCVKKPLKARAGKIKFDFKNPYLWWPKGYGEPNLYDIKAEVISDGKILARKEFKAGLRTIRLDRTETTDGKNGNFAFVINDEEIFCKGTNWVALDAFHSRDAQRYEKALKLLDDIGCNMVRMWGGNVYEDDEFYDFCDSHGIMVWQDFAMACNAYPHTREFLEEIENEAITIVKKLRHHPSIVLWAGDNECDSVMLNEAVWQNPNINPITRDVFARVIYNHDFTRPYLPSSPYYSQKAFDSGSWDSPSENHIWGPRDYYKSKFYSESKAHFISESGYHGCPSEESLRKFLPEEDIYPGAITDAQILHSTDWDGDDKRVRLVSEQIIQMFGFLPDNMEDFVFASQLSQAEATKYFVERMRIGRPCKKGILWWNLIDGWPQVSDAVVDYYFNKKLAYKWLKTSQMPFCIMIDEIENWNLKVVAGNDTLKNVSGKVTVSDIDSGEVLFESDFEVEKNRSETIGEIRMMYSSHKFLVIKWNIDGKEYKNHYICGQVPLDLEKCREWTRKF